MYFIDYICDLRNLELWITEDTVGRDQKCLDRLIKMRNQLTF